MFTLSRHLKMHKNYNRWFVTFVERDLLLQYLVAKTLVRGASDHILKVVDTYKNSFFSEKVEKSWLKICRCGVIYAVFYTKSLGFPITH